MVPSSGLPKSADLKKGAIPKQIRYESLVGPQLILYAILCQETLL